MTDTTDAAITIKAEPIDRAERIEMLCDLLATAPFAVQEDVPLDDLHAWIAGVRENSRALDVARVAAEQRSARLREALRSADSRIVQYKAEEYTRRTGDLPSREWFLSANGAQESNHYAVDGLEFGDLDTEPARAEGGEA